MNSGDMRSRGCNNTDSKESNKASENRPSTHASVREMTYHYAGKVHVRGLLRRVWRPRYLALGDDGYLRYHESIPPLLQQDLQQRRMLHSSHDSYSTLHSMIHHTHRPKTILAVLDGARIIDPHSMMDRHVALPQGVYGFVFRGRPVELYTTDSSNSKERVASALASGGDTEQGALIVLPEVYNSSLEHDKKNSESSVASSHANKHSTKAAVVNLVFPRGTSRRRAAQKIAKKAINPDVLCGLVRANCEGGISRSSSSSSLMGYEQTVLQEESGSHDEYVNELPSRNEWGCDSYESHNTIGSFQEVEGSHVCRDLNDSVPNHRTERRDKMQKASSKSIIQVQVQASSIQSREYLCAVSTSEEAESWVVALKWAAEHRRRIKHGNSTRMNESIINTTLPSPPLPNATGTFGKNVISDSQTNNSIEDGHKGIGNIGNSGEEYGFESTSNRNSSTSVANSGVESSTHKDSGGDSKGSLTSLLIEQDGWCKAETGKNRVNSNEDICDPIPLSALTSNMNVEAQILTGNDPKLSTQLNPPSPLLFPKKDTSSPGGATIVVTKASRLQMPHNALLGWANTGNCHGMNMPWIPFHFPLPGDELVLHYEIQILLLRHCRSRNEISVQPESMEERTIYKSIYDVLALVRDLMLEFDTNKRGDLIQEDGQSDQFTPTRKGRTRPMQESNDTFHLLEDVESNLLSCLGAKKETSQNGMPTLLTELSSAFSEAIATVGNIDSVVRKLSKESSICSSHHFQEFLCLRTNHHRSSLPAKPNHKATAMMVSKEADAEQIVRKWLCRPYHQSARSKVELILAITLRHRLGGPMLSLMVVWSATRLASTIWFILSGTRINISIPLETYAMLIALSFFFGHITGMSSQTRHDERGLKEQRSNLEKQRSNEPSPTPIASPKGDKFEGSAESEEVEDDDHSTVAEEGSAESEDDLFIAEPVALSSPLPLFPANNGISCWSKPHHAIFMVRSTTYFEDRIKSSSAPAVFQCRGVDVWITDNAERNIARHPSVLGGELDRENTFIVNFLLPFANLVAYFSIPPIEEMPANIADVWCRFIKGDQQYRDGKLKLLPVVVDGPWIVKKAVGPGTSPAMIGRDLPLQYYFTEPTAKKKGVYEVDVLVTASRIARGILNVVKGHTKSLTIAFAFIIEASEEAQLPETVLCAFQVHELHLEDCPNLPDCYPDG